MLSVVSMPSHSALSSLAFHIPSCLFPLCQILPQLKVLRKVLSPCSRSELFGDVPNLYAHWRPTVFSNLNNLTLLSPPKPIAFKTKISVLVVLTTCSRGISWNLPKFFQPDHWYSVHHERAPIFSTSSSVPTTDESQTSDHALTASPMWVLWSCSVLSVADDMKTSWQSSTWPCYFFARFFRDESRCRIAKHALRCKHSR